MLLTRSHTYANQDTIVLQDLEFNILVNQVITSQLQVRLPVFNVQLVNIVTKVTLQHFKIVLQGLIVHLVLDMGQNSCVQKELILILQEVMILQIVSLVLQATTVILWEPHLIIY